MFVLLELSFEESSHRIIEMDYFQDLEEDDHDDDNKKTTSDALSFFCFHLLCLIICSWRNCKCPWISKSNAQSFTNWLPFSYSTFNNWNESCKLYNVWKSGLSRISCSESISACSSLWLCWYNRSLNRFNMLLASAKDEEKRKRERNDMFRSINQSRLSRVFLCVSYHIIEPWWEKSITNGMHDPNSSIDKYCDVSLSFLSRIDEKGRSRDRKSTTTSSRQGNNEGKEKKVMH